MRRILLLLLPVAAFVVVVAACTRGAVLPNTISYALDPVAPSTVNGTVTFQKTSETVTEVTIDVAGLSAGQTYPAHIHSGDSPNGPIYINLTSVDGDTGISVTAVSATNAGEPVDYEFLVNYDGFVNVHEVGGTPILATGETGLGANDVQIEP
jgi:hypothetical protein